MASNRPSFRIAAPSFLLALVLVGGSVAPAIARDSQASPGGVMGGSATRTSARTAPTAARQPLARIAWRLDEAARAVEPAPESAPEVRPPTPDLPVAKPVAMSRSVGTTSRADSAPAATGYHGRNHVWIPSLGVNRSISFYACSRNTYPGDRVYRWGCAGSNNVYLFGHASSVFEPLHDAYVAGRLRKGMAVYYANDDGVVHRYTVRWWKVTTPDKGAWAFASQSKPSLTLQTCVGARSQYRLVVRLVQAD